LLVAGFVCGCLPDDPLSSGGCGTVVNDPLALITVSTAHLEDLELWQAGAGAGRTDGSATLVVTDVDGELHEFDAMLQGSHMGLVLDASVDVAFNTEFPLVLPENAAITVRQLLGTYEGTHVGVDLIAGFHWRELKNPSQVRLNITTLSFGLGFVPITWEVLGLQLFDDPVQFGGGGGGCGLFGCLPACNGGDGVCDVGCGDPDCTCEDEGDCEDPDDGDALNDLCDVSGPGERGSCAPDLVCVRRDDRDVVGICRMPCADDASVCDDVSPGFGFATCQQATVLPSLVVEAVVCLDQFGADAPCGAAFDANACTEGAECRPIGAVPEDLRCKETCDDGRGADDDDGVVDACSDPLEQCLPMGTFASLDDRAAPSTCGVAVDALPAFVAARASSESGARRCA
jgi:hypothetical protein